MTPTLALLALLSASPAEPLEPPEEPKEVVLHGSGWCPFLDEDDEEEEVESPGCGVGLGAALARYKRAAWVVALGDDVVGTGISWTLNPDRPEGRPERRHLLVVGNNTRN